MGSPPSSMIEFITHRGILTQPSGAESRMNAFVSIIRITTAMKSVLDMPPPRHSSGYFSCEQRVYSPNANGRKSCVRKERYWARSTTRYPPIGIPLTLPFNMFWSRSCKLSITLLLEQDIRCRCRLCLIAFQSIVPVSLFISIEIVKALTCTSTSLSTLPLRTGTFQMISARQARSLRMLWSSRNV